MNVTYVVLFLNPFLLWHVPWISELTHSMNMYSVPSPSVVSIKKNMTAHACGNGKVLSKAGYTTKVSSIPFIGISSIGIFVWWEAYPTNENKVKAANMEVAKFINGMQTVAKNNGSLSFLCEANLTIVFCANPAENKTCPAASPQILRVKSFDQSGLKRYAHPALCPSKESPFTNKMVMRM